MDGWITTHIVSAYDRGLGADLSGTFLAWLGQNHQNSDIFAHIKYDIYAGVETMLRMSNDAKLPLDAFHDSALAAPWDARQDW